MTFFKTAVPISTPQSAVLSAHDALILLKMSFSAPKMLHTLRNSPCVIRCQAMFDSLLRKGIGTICNLDLTDIQWLQASLPVKDGGLGVRRVSSLASSAFLASAAATDALQQQLLFRSSIAGTTSVHGQGRMVINLHHQLCYRPSSNQSTWDRAVTALERHTMTCSLSDPTDKAWLQWLAARTYTIRLRSAT